MPSSIIYIPCSTGTIHRLLVTNYSVAFLDHKKGDIRKNIFAYRMTVDSGDRVEKLDGCSVVMMALKMAKKINRLGMTHLDAGGHCTLCHSRMVAGVDGLTAIDDKGIQRTSYTLCQLCHVNLIHLVLSRQFFQNNISPHAYDWLPVGSLNKAQEFLRGAYSYQLSREVIPLG